MMPFELPAAGGYVVALSGGADSRLLLELAVRASLARDGRERVVAAHLNHGIRGAEANRDEEFCRAECKRLGVPLYVEHADIPALCRESGESEETAARRVRYEFFVRVMKETGLPVLLTAHNADDQLETLLFHLLRGSGTRGMIGIPAARTLDDHLPDGTPLAVHRPLLTWSRRDILDAVAELGLSYVTDSTNLADTCTRNRLRHRVTPLLEDMTGPGVPQAAAVRLGQTATEDEAALATLARERYEAAITPAGLPAAAAAAAGAAIGKRMIHMAYAAHLGSSLSSDRTLSAYHLEALRRLCSEGREGAVSDRLPGGLRAEVRNGCLSFSPAAPERAPTPCPLRPLDPGLTVWQASEPRITVEIEMLEGKPTDAPAEPLTGGTVFASAVFPPMPLAARTREAGDVILSHGMTKKLKKIICDRHIPTELRDRLPLFCLPDGTPLWFPGAAFRDGYPPPADGRALRVTVHAVHAVHAAHTDEHPANTI